MVGVQEVVGSCGEKDEDCSLSDQVMGLAELELVSTETTVIARSTALRYVALSYNYSYYIFPSNISYNSIYSSI